MHNSGREQFEKYKKNIQKYGRTGTNLLGKVDCH